MPNKLRVLSNKEIIKILAIFGFNFYSQRGSHIKLRRTINGHNQVLTVPAHKELTKGTIKAIYEQSSKYIPEEELDKHFYTK